jgi:hypothetical protein
LHHDIVQTPAGGSIPRCSSSRLVAPDAVGSIGVGCLLGAVEPVLVAAQTGQIVGRGDRVGNRRGPTPVRGRDGRRSVTTNAIGPTRVRGLRRSTRGTSVTSPTVRIVVRRHRVRHVRTIFPACDPGKAKSQKQQQIHSGANGHIFDHRLAFGSGHCELGSIIGMRKLYETFIRASSGGASGRLDVALR